MPFPTDTEPDTELEQLLDRELERQNTGLQLIASENFTSPAVMRADRFGAHQQVLRGLPGQALLRRQRRHRRGRGARHRAGQGAVRRRARQRPAALRRQRQHVRVPGAAAAGRHGARPQPRPRRPPHPRLAGQRQRPALPLRRLQGDAGRRAHRHGPGPRPRPRAPPEDDRRRHDELPPPHRPRAVPGHRRRGRRAVHVRRRPHRRAHRRRRPPRTRCRTPTSSRSRPTRRCAARAAAASSPRPSTPRRSTRPCSPGWQGGPLEHVIAGQGGRLPRGGCTRLQATTPTRSWRNAVGAGRGARRRGLPPGVGRHRQPPDGRRPAPVRRRAHRQGGPDDARRGRHHAQQEHDPRRSPQPVRHQRRAHRHAVGDDPGHARARDGRIAGLIAQALRERESPAGARRRCGPRSPSSAPPSRPTPDPDSERASHRRPAWPANAMARVVDRAADASERAPASERPPTACVAGERH